MDNLIDCCVDKNLLHSDNDFTPQTRETLDKISDSATLFAALTLPEKFIEMNNEPPSQSMVKSEDIDLGWKKTGEGFHDWKRISVRTIKHKISPSFSVDMIGEDDLFGKYTFLEKLTGRALRNRCFLPLEDSDIILKNDEEAAAILSDLKLKQGEALPKTYTNDFNMMTDESFSRIFFHGMGSVLLAKQEKVSDSEYGPFVVDMPLEHLKVRNVYREYGACIHFSKDQKVSAIYDYKFKKLFKPDDFGWGEAKMLAKVTAFLLITVREHLTWTHLLCSNTATRESTLKLSPSHPIRRLLTVFTFRANEINLGAFDKLVPNTSILHRSVGLEYSSTVDVFEMSFKTSNVFEPFSERTYNPALEELSNEGKFPYISQGSQYFDIVRTFVRNWLEKSGLESSTDKEATAFYNAMKESTKGQKYELPDFSSKDAMLNLLSSIIFTVTAYHELVGHVVDYTLLPSRSGFRLTKADPSKIDLQSFINASLITASTSVTMPKLMSEFSNFFGPTDKLSWEIEVWKKFCDELEVQSKKVQAEEEMRDVEFKYFDPDRFECSVSV